MRIYFVGSHCSGKTTLARYVSQKYDLPMITEVARSVLAEMETPLERLRTDLDLVDSYQENVFERQLEAESLFKANDSFVSDRAFDNLAYASEHSRIAEKITRSASFRRYIDSFKKSNKLLFFVRPQKGLLSSDGVRETPEWDSICRIDGMVKLLLEMHGLKYVSIATPSMQERTAIIDLVISKSK
jgi:nicotinamide riboside kinase